MDFKHHLERAWHLTLDNIVPLILMTLVMVAVSIATLGILSMVAMAGYTRSILLMIRTGREPQPKDVFSEMRLFLPLLAFSIAVAVILAIGFILLVLPAFVFGAAISWICLYMLPLMIDKRYGVIEAVKASFEIVRQKDDLKDHLVLLILVIGISAAGGSVFIGWLFTQPFAMILLLSVYEEKIADTPAAAPANPPPAPSEAGPEGP